MTFAERIVLVGALGSVLVSSAWCQESVAPVSTPPPQDVSQLLEQLRAQDARLKELEVQVRRLERTAAVKAGEDTTAAPAAPTGAVEAQPVPSAAPSTAEAAIPAPVIQTEAPAGEHEHSMQLPGGGPVFKVRGFADFNLGFGPDANALIFPLPPPIHNTFEIGEFDLFLSSRLSRQISFLSEIVIGADQTNYWGLDIERMQITYKPSRYFEISGGRYHTSIGYYNTAFHHGTWFQTATGRPFMYFFEDSGGVLPVHSIGITAGGLVPGTESLGLHWTAEVGNGRSSDPSGQPVQNFFSDKNHKDFNVAAYIKPQKIAGLQLGGSYYRDRLVPALIPHVNQSISSLYAVYTDSAWESLNEIVLMHNQADGFKSYNNPLVYTQISRKFGKYRPYVRFQYLNIANNDPVSIYTGRYEGPSAGLRMDFTNYAALKVQYNRLYQRNQNPENGLDLQVAFTF